MWNEIKDQNNIDDFMKLFGRFHDSCIKEFKYVSGAYVSEDLSMNPVNSKNTLKIIFQRQFNNPSAIEMEFSELLELRMFPLDDNFTCEILAATMIIENEDIYWYDCDMLTKKDRSNYKGTLICSSKVRWRVADEYIGQGEIYQDVKCRS